MWPWPLTSKINRVHPLVIMSAKYDKEIHNSLGLTLIAKKSLHRHVGLQVWELITRLQFDDWRHIIHHWKGNFHSFETIFPQDQKRRYAPAKYELFYCSFVKPKQRYLPDFGPRYHNNKRPKGPLSLTWVQWTCQKGSLHFGSWEAPSKVEKLKYLLYTQWFAKLEEILFILTLQYYLHLNFYSFRWDNQWNVLILKPFQ